VITAEPDENSSTVENSRANRQANRRYTIQVEQEHKKNEVEKAH